MLTRSQVAQRIRRSIATVRKMEGQSLHPEYGPRGALLFDPVEVEEVAERIARSGRALADQTTFRELRNSNGCSTRERQAQSEGTSSSELARLRRCLHEERVARAKWRAEVEDAVENVLSSVKSTDDDTLDALEDLVDLLRSD